MSMRTKNPVRPMSGADYIGDFNPEGREDVEELKKMATEFIDMIQLYGYDKRRNAIAITHIEEAAMMAVKSIFA